MKNRACAHRDGERQTTLRAARGPATLSVRGHYALAMDLNGILW
jgi:hypothetical protein